MRKWKIACKTFTSFIWRKRGHSGDSSLTCHSHIDLNRRPFKMWHRHLCIFVILASAVLVHADDENVVEEKDSQRLGKGIIRNG